MELALDIFTNDTNFPFFIQYGHHDESLFLHSHKDFSELVIVLEGSADHIVDQERYRIQKGDVFVISNDTVHGYESVEHVRICNIMFRPDFFSMPELDIAESAGFQALFILEPHFSRTAGFCSRLRLDIDAFSKVTHMIESIHHEYAERQTGWKTLVTADFMRLAVYLSRRYLLDSGGNKNRIMQLADSMAYIEKHYTEQISIAALAALSHYSERQFIRLFKEAFSCLPMVYITNLRMQKARELLRNAELSITEVAVRCGYGDCNYFSRIFRKNNGMTPSAYRAFVRTEHLR